MTVQRRAQMAQNQYGERVIRIEFPYDLDVLNKIRSLPGRVWHKEEKCWSAPIYESTLNNLIKWNFILDDPLLNFLKKINNRKCEVENGNALRLKGELYPFQKEGVSWIETHNGRALIADEMGLGKTVQAIGWMQLHPEIRPVVIICPATLKLTWANEIAKWTDETDVAILSGTRSRTIKEKIIIINYDILHDWLSVLKIANPKLVILDEMHYIKSNSTKRTKATKLLTKGVDHVIALSGTPIINRPIEAFNTLKILNPDLFPDYWNFTRRYCNRKHNGFGWDVSGHANERELHQKLVSTLMIRRLKKDVLKELPDKIYSHIPIEINNSKEYDEAEWDFIEFVRQTKGDDAARRASNAEAFTKIEVLKQLSVKGKLKRAIEWIHDFLEVDGKLVVFATHVFIIDALMKEFSKIAVKIDGSTSMRERQIAVDKFQTDESVQLFVGNVKAAGVGITLTASSNVAFIELPWTPGELDQATDRCHRISQKDTVNVYYLLAKGTIDMHLAQIIDMKRKVTSTVLDGQLHEDTSLLHELMKHYE